VAIKVLNRQLAANATARRRFLREGKAAAAVNHPNVLTIHSVEEHRGTPFLVMEFVGGKSLKEHIAARGRLDPQETLRLGAQIAQGLAAAHAQGVIHRDVKPGNVMLHDGATRVRLTDFGLARVTFDLAELTTAGAVMGTPAYMAPEQVRGEQVDARADLFSLGCVLYAMLTGRSPFAGRTHAETIHKILDSTPLSLAKCDPPTPPALCGVVERLLQKDPANRIQTAQETAEILLRFQADINRSRTDEMARVLAQPLPHAAPVSPPKASLPTIPLPASRFRSGLWLVISGLLLLGLALGGWKLWERLQVVNAPAAHAPAVPVKPLEASPPEALRLSEITVATDGSGQFRSLAAALARAADGATITVLDEGPYAESLSLDQRPNGLRLLAPHRAVLRSPPTGDRTLLRLRNVRDVTVHGFRLETEAGSKGQAILLTGTAGATFDDLQFVPGSEALGSTLVRCDAQGPDSSLVLRHCRLTLPSRGTGVWIDGHNPAGSVEIVDNQFAGPLSQLVVFGSCRRLRIAGNVFDGATNAINLDVQRWHPETQMVIANNTFVRTQFWLGLLQTFKASQPASQISARVCNNLILGGERIQAGDEQLEHAWLTGSSRRTGGNATSRRSPTPTARDESPSPSSRSRCPNAMRPTRPSICARPPIRRWFRPESAVICPSTWARKPRHLERAPDSDLPPGGQRFARGACCRAMTTASIATRRASGACAAPLTSSAATSGVRCTWATTACGGSTGERAPAEGAVSPTGFNSRTLADPPPPPGAAVAGNPERRIGRGPSWGSLRRRPVRAGRSPRPRRSAARILRRPALPRAGRNAGRSSSRRHDNGEWRPARNASRRNARW
jgi:eukaryotic-like serine/threonine-protein kinase